MLTPNRYLPISRPPAFKMPIRAQTCANENNIQHTRGTGLRSIENSHTAARPVSLERVLVAVVQIHFEMLAPRVPDPEGMIHLTTLSSEMATLCLETVGRPLNRCKHGERIRHPSQLDKCEFHVHGAM